MESVANTYDLSFLRNFTNGDGEKLKFYIKIYLRTAAQMFGEIEASLDTINHENLYQKVHSLKPQTTYVGITGLSELLVKIEEAVLEGRDNDTIKTLVQEAIDLNKKGMAELEQHFFNA